MAQSSYESLSHSKWDCKFHVVFVPKYRKKVLYRQIRKFLGPLFHDLASHRSCKILEGHMVQDHVHMLIAIPPKYSVSEVIGYISGRKRNFNGEKFCARVYAVSTVGFEEVKIKEYIRNQEQLEAQGVNEDGI